MEKEFEYCVFIGRFQPAHDSHLEAIKQAFTLAEKVIVVIGSARSARNIKNPFSFEERKYLIESGLACRFDGAVDLSRITFVPIRDYYYNENAWVTELQQKIAALTNYSNSIALLGTFKDSSSYYLKLFPQWEFVPVSKEIDMMDATSVREALFTGNIENVENVPNAVYEYLLKFSETELCKDLVTEYQFIKGYKDQWASAPYPPTFVTTDAVVIQSGHILVVKRKFHPGKGLFALPGGFIRANEQIEGAMLRELKEETGIKVAAPILKSNIVDSKVFDHPDRSLRGRTITHAYCIQLGSGELPEIKSGSDADRVMWLPLMDALGSEEKFFEDHAHIIRYFVSKF